MIKVVLFDLDGVIRHFDEHAVAEIEASHFLAPGSIAAFAFSEPHLTDVTTGRITRAQWVRRIGDHVENHVAAGAWATAPSHIDDEVVQLATELRSLGLTTAILTNGTDTIPAELRALDLPPTFGTVFNSAEIGRAKPDPAVFHHVLGALGVDANEVFFIDDTPRNLTAAADLGIVTHRFVDVPRLRAALVEVGIVTTSSSSSSG
ncbi:HAD family phosphatase [Cellulomonas sp. zg-ZUI222]|uniref:HAD family hydrolase n=1 Tax=Cellulomonas TaxID=1707 RepID=UPI001A93CBBF|nr:MULTISPECIES: HAD family phosphatase [Cellulomonas]MBO0898676.1 HAD family phosphatase [Cellulomonas sp. zg-ZUI22]MBO0919539.1 HAD family phosphatase [Cellulomonas wangleii]